MSVVFPEATESSGCDFHTESVIGRTGAAFTGIALVPTIHYTRNDLRADYVPVCANTTKKRTE